MNALLRRLRQRLCRHAEKRVWDINRLPEGTFRVRLYCPACGWRQDVLREPEALIHDAAGSNPDMRDTMRRKLAMEPEDTHDGARPPTDGNQSES